MDNRNRCSDVHTTILDVGGMSCEACLRHVARALEGMTGVVHVDVSLRDHRAVVEHLPAYVDVAGLTQAVRDAGYAARVSQSEPDAGSSSPQATRHLSPGCGCRSQRMAVTRSANLGTSTIG